MPQDSDIQAPEPTPPPVTPSMRWRIYEAAKSHLGKHITLDPSVPPDLGCSEAVSFVLKQAGITGLPKNGIQGTAQLYIFLKQNTKQFAQVSSPEYGDIIISPTGSPGALFEHGHVGICAKFGILSNNSYTGRFDEHITLDGWNDFYRTRGRFPVFFFSAL